jgi:hypothetical protein
MPIHVVSYLKHYQYFVGRLFYHLILIWIDSLDFKMVLTSFHDTVLNFFSKFERRTRHQRKTVLTGYRTG